MKKPRVLILGAGFAGLELSTVLSQEMGDAVDVTLIEGADAFVFGFAKLDVLFGRATVDGVKHPYGAFDKRGVKLVREKIKSIDPHARRVETTGGSYDADVLVVALGADYDVSKTPGVVLGKNEFYSVEGARHLAGVLPTFKKGQAVVGVCGAPYKCPPAPSECALMLHEYLVERGLRGDCGITVVHSLSSPVPPAPEAAAAILKEFEARGITYLPNRRVVAVDEARRVVKVDDGSELPCDLFLGVPVNRAPDVVVASGMTEGGWIPVDPRTLATKWPDVYAVGDIANTGVPKAGLFAEAAARAVAENLISRFRAEEEKAKNPGAGACYIDFGGGQVARVDVDFLSGPTPTGTYNAPNATLMTNKKEFGTTREARWFGA